MELWSGARRCALGGALAVAMIGGGCALEPGEIGAVRAEARGGIPGPPRRDAGPPPASSDASSPAASTCCSQRTLGSLPRELRHLAWPALPAIAGELHVSTDAELAAALRERTRTRIHVHGVHLGLYVLARSDVELMLDADAFIEHLLIARSQHRVRVVGGTFAAIEMMPPVDYPNGGTEPEAALMATDVTIECVTVHATDTAFLVRGSRVAILGADVTAERYALYAGDAAPLPIDDVIVAHSVLRAAGPEATYRLQGVRRSVVASTTLSNPLKHNWRVHGDSELNYLGDSTLVGTGAMLGWVDGDSLERAWFVRNTVYYDASSGLFLAEPTRVSRLVVTDNVVYSDEPFDPGAGPRWTVARNVTSPYEPPPSSVFTCR